MLGLAPGATQAEVKRAYRRLAKAFHPDSAGERALPRFLAIRDAYERLTSAAPRVPRPASQPGSGSAGTPRPQPRPPWQADPGRARAAREAARRARDAARAARQAAEDAGPSAGSATAGGEAHGGGEAPRGGETPRGPSRSRGRTRPGRKATLGSTSYDEAREQTDPRWSGASWYGPTSGEYWTVNPREYADPRKHGPEYQARGRAARPGEAEGDAAGAGGEGESSAGVHEPPLARASTAERRQTYAAPGDRWASGMEGHAASASGWTGPADEVGADTTRHPPPRPAPPVVGDAAARSLRDRTGMLAGGGRLPAALLAWPPLALASAEAIGQATGCARYAATCTGLAPLLPWLAQGVILALLLLAPSLARLLSAGTLGVLVALVPATGVLLAVGANFDPRGGAALVMLLTLAWLAGVALAAWARLRGRSPVEDGPVS